MRGIGKRVAIRSIKQGACAQITNLKEITMRKRSSCVVGLMMGGLIATTAPGQVILMNDSSADVCHVIDPATGDVTGSFDTSFSTTGINIIDGPDGTLLMSDQSNDTVYQLNADGTLIGDYITAPIDNIRGIDMVGNFLVGATTDGVFAWDANGDILANSVAGDFFDVDNASSAYGFPGIVATDLTSDTIHAYRYNGNFVTNTVAGGDFLEQTTPIEIVPGSFCVGVVAFTGANVTVYFTSSGNIDYQFPITGAGRGLVQLDNGNLLVSSNSELAEYTVRGTYVRQIMAGTGFRYLEHSNNYMP